MGSFLDKPITEKETLNGAGNGLVWGVSAMQGWRVEMEDAHTCEVSVPGMPETSFFAVYDGHGGKTVSTIAGVQLLPMILQGQILASGDKSPDTLSKALYQGLFDLDAKMLEQEPKLASGEDHSGSTCIASFITPTHVILANCGDSRAVLSRKGQVHFATQDHKPTDPAEVARVEAAGGFIEMSRVCGNLAVSRSLGDYQYKDRNDIPPQNQKICSASDMTTIPRAADDDFLLLCCDGIWDVMSNQQAVDFVIEHLRAGIPAPQICERMLDHCLIKNSKDNMSVNIIVMPGAPKQVEGYTVPDIHADGDDAERAKTETADAQALARRLSTIMNSLQGQEQAGGTPPAATGGR